MRKEEFNQDARENGDEDSSRKDVPEIADEIRQDAPEEKDVAGSTTAARRDFQDEKKGGGIGKIVKWSALVIMYSIICLFIIRCCMAADRSKFSGLKATDALKAAWADGESEILTSKIEKENSDRGYFTAYGFYYNPESGEVQFAVRWNRSAYTYTAMEEDHEFEFYLLLNGEEPSEAEPLPTAVWPARAVDSDSMSMYRYRKMLVEGVEAGDGDKLTVVMKLRDGDEDQLVLKYAELPFKTYEPKKSFLKEVRGQ